MKNIFYGAACMVILASCNKEQNNFSTPDSLTANANAGGNNLKTLSATLPRDILDLSKWKLSKPVDANGGNTGAATSVDSTGLKAGYTSSYFYTSSDNGVVFWCPTDGATTTPGQGSDHPRTELGEYRLWALSEKGKLQATLVVNKHPIDTADIIIGQIHGGGSNGSAPFVMLHLKDGVVAAYIRQSLTLKQYHKHNLIEQVPTGAKIYYSIYSNGNSIYFNTTVTPPGSTASTSATWQDPIPSEFNAPGVVVHFSAGDYVQEHTPNDGLFPNSTNGGRVTFYKLDITHY